MSRPVSEYIPADFLVQLAGVEMEIARRAMRPLDPAARGRRRTQAPAVTGHEIAAAVTRAVRLLGAGAALMGDEFDLEEPDLIEQAIYQFVAATAWEILGAPACAAALAQGRAVTADRRTGMHWGGTGEPDQEGSGPEGRFDGAPPPAYLVAPAA